MDHPWTIVDKNQKRTFSEDVPLLASSHGHRSDHRIMVATDGALIGKSKQQYGYTKWSTLLVLVAELLFFALINSFL